ncbi:hypothetical protein CFC21_002191 [Triticum aestivum]|uniref:QWRF motif-containing protein 7 n=3 Tax=Triticum TaxID=4564 RepID=A0A9R0Q712_TRITD|nr:QWRF motif-containing protein 7-like [Triticum dicoccoides]XP_044408999.1 QWRF motif-containing protein 7-like [Triticum aestivum]XP_048534319.1 QWRF motif-containing protein 7-like [Triticum urartu]KAF6984145.1 hypothetical protein CFC21_002191 [Triticum aestivum]VAH06152.1 unnamed protein product [Triticum turgidum subsp. durum]
MESAGGSIPRPQTASARRLGRSSSSASRAGAGAFAYDGMRAAPLFSSANFARSLRKAASFGHKKKPSAGDADAAAQPPRRALSSKDQNTVHGADAGAVTLSPRRSPPQPGVGARQGPWEPARRRRSTGGASPDETPADKVSAGALRDMMMRKREGSEKEETVHRARVLATRLLQWRFANARMEKAAARATSAAENKLFYTWLRVAELRNIHAAKRIVAQRRRQKLKLERLLRPQLPLLAPWESLEEPHSDAVSDLAGALSAACTPLPVTAGAQVDMESLREIVFACVGTATEIEANADRFYATAGATSGALGELARTIRQEVEGLEEAMRLSRVVTRLQMQEASLRTNLVQAKQKRDHDMGVAFVAPATAASGWCY